MFHVPHYVNQITVLLLLTLSVSVQSQGWLEIGAQTSLAIDWAQTIKAQSSMGVYTDDIKYHKYVETNPILGKHPSHLKTSIYFSSVMVTHYFVAKALPKKFRIPLQITTIVIQYRVIKGNHKQGIRLW